MEPSRRSTRLLSLLLILAVPWAVLDLRAQAPALPAAPIAASAPAQPKPAVHRTSPSGRPRQSAQPRHSHHRWRITAAIAVAAAIVTGIVVYLHRPRKPFCGICA